MAVIERWDDEHCPNSQRGDGGHCAHADTHDVCDWCGAQWGEGGAMLVPVERLRGAVFLSDAEWKRVLWWLHKPLPPGPAKSLDEAIIRKITTQRGQ
jgi:hypothetical protein